MQHTKFWDDLVPAAILGVTISISGLGLLLMSLEDVTWLLGKQAVFYTWVILFTSSILAGIYLGIRVKEDFFINGIALGAFITFIELIITVPMLNNFVGNWNLSVINAIGGMTFAFPFAIIGALVGMAPGYFMKHFKKVQ